MVAITATNSATPSLQATLLNARRATATRDADQAEANAKNLRAQANAQDRVAQQAHQRARAAEASAGAPAATASGPQPPLSGTPKTLGQSGASYVEVLSSVLQAGKPLMSADYTYAAQKNIVVSSLFQAATNVWTADLPPTPPVRQYATQGSTASIQSTGSLLNILA